MKSMLLRAAPALFVLLAAPLSAQETRPDAASRPVVADDAAGGFDRAAQDVRAKLEQSLAELNALREKVGAEQLPLAKRLNELEAELARVREEARGRARAVDERVNELGALQRDVDARKKENAYLAGLFGDYVRNLEARLPIAELKRFEASLRAAKDVALKSGEPDAAAFKTQTDVVAASLERLANAVGGERFDGAAVDPSGAVREGTFVVLGPTIVFRSKDGATVGTVEQRVGSLEPSVAPFGSPEDAAAAAKFVVSGEGDLPLDVTLGNARKVESIEEPLLVHVKKGGPLMYPIVGLALLALLVALWRWLALTFVRTPSQRRLKALLDAVARRDHEEALELAEEMGGPTGRMLASGVRHVHEPRELIEEVMYETVIESRIRLNRALPFIALTSSSAPLFGLLGTVTGIMNTFALMTVFGSGDTKSLSSGISEALITTEWGLYVAIPSLILYAFLSRKAKGIVEGMERAALAFLNQIAKSQPAEGADGAAAPAGAARASALAAAS